MIDLIKEFQAIGEEFKANPNLNNAEKCWMKNRLQFIRSEAMKFRKEHPNE
jgi:hypothetical protein